MHGTCKSGESCISFKERNSVFVHSWGKKGAVIYHDFINCVHNFDNAHTFATSKYLLQEVTGTLYTSLKVSLFL